MTVIDLFFQQIDFIEEYYQRNVFQIAVRESEDLNMNPRTYITTCMQMGLEPELHPTSDSHVVVADVVVAAVLNISCLNG